MKIKSLFICSAILFAALGLASCSADYDTDFTKKELEVPHSSQHAIVFAKEGGTQDIEVKTNVALDDWTATSNAEWLTVTKKADGTGVTATAPAYSGYKMRQAVITVQHGAKDSYTINVSQMGLQSVLTIPEQDPFFNRQSVFSALLEADETSLTVPVETNLNLDYILIPDTVDFVTLDKSKIVTENNIMNIPLTLEKNTGSKSRFCTITLQSSDNWDATKQLVIEQAPKGVKVRSVYPTNNPKGVSISLVDMPRTYRVPFQRTEADGNYTIAIPENAKEWLSVSKTLVSGSELQFNSKLNTTDNARTADVVCTPNGSGKQPFTIHVTQEPFQNVNPNGVQNIRVTPGDGTFNVTWTDADDPNYENVLVEARSAMSKVPLSTQTVSASEHSCTLNDVFKFAGDYTITVTTVGLRGKKTLAPVTATAQAKEWSENVPVKLNVDMLSANSINKSHGLAYAVDGSTSTYFQTKTNGSTSEPKPYIDIALNEPISGLFSITFAKSGTQYPNRANIYGSTDGSHWDLLKKDLLYQGPDVEPAEAVSADKPYTHLRFEPTRRNSSTVISNGRTPWQIAELYLNIVHDETWKKQQLGITD